MQISLGAIGKGILELIEDAVFAPHVVRRTGLLPKRWATQYQLLVRVLDQIRQVGCAARKLTDRRRTVKLRNVRFQVRIYQGNVQLFASANVGGLVSQCHIYPFCLLWSARIID